jgi:hypothetical protein
MQMPNQLIDNIASPVNDAHATSQHIQISADAAGTPDFGFAENLYPHKGRRFITSVFGACINQDIFLRRDAEKPLNASAVFFFAPTARGGWGSAPPQ